MSKKKQFEPLSEPLLIKAGDSRVLLGFAQKPPLVDCRVVAEEKYQEMTNIRNQLVEALKDAHMYMLRTFRNSYWNDCEDEPMFNRIEKVLKAVGEEERVMSEGRRRDAIFVDTRRIR